MRWTTMAPAKLNLDLRMHGVRADGYHLLTTVLQSIAIGDRVALHARPGRFAMTCAAADVPTDATNLAWKGAAAMAAHLGVPLDGWHLDLDKQVPAASGLGGGSADAAAAARLVAAAVGRPVDPAELAEVIGPLGADVPFFAWGGTALGEGIGDRLTPLADMPPAAVLLVRPPFGVSTRDAYGWFDQTPAADRGRPRADTRPEGEWAGFANDLEAPVATRHPEIACIVARLKSAGAEFAAMSGSGSACFGLFHPDADLSGLAHGWPEGTRIWHTALLDRRAYADRTACLRG